MISDADKEQQLQGALTRAFAALDFSPDVSVPWGSAHAAFWFSRRRTNKTEAIACRLRWSPEAVLSVNCVVSDHTLDVLERIGLEDNAAALNLFNYQVVFLERDASELLPQAISLTLAASRTWSVFVEDLAQRIAFEMDSAQAIWKELAE